MKKPLIPDSEDLRLKALQNLSILDSDPEQSIDELTRLAAEICDVPIALVSLIDKDRQWFKSRFGLNVTETDRDISFCGHAINQTKPFIVADAKADARFHDNPLVTGFPNIQFYCGNVLKTEEGHSIGTLCVIDRKPKILSNSQLSALKVIAHQIMVRLETGRKNNAYHRVSSTDARAIPCLATYLDQLHAIVASIETCSSESQKQELKRQIDQLSRISILQSSSLATAHRLDEAELLVAFARSLLFFKEVIHDHQI